MSNLPFPFSPNLTKLSFNINFPVDVGSSLFNKIGIFDISFSSLFSVIFPFRLFHKKSKLKCLFSISDKSKIFSFKDFIRT